MLLPLQLIATTFLGLLSLGLLAGGIYSLYRGIRKARQRYCALKASRSQRSRPGDPPQAAPLRMFPRVVLGDRMVIVPLMIGLFVPLFSLFGRHVIQYGFPAAQDEPKAMRNGLIRYVEVPDGARVHVEYYGPSDAPTLLFTHGWGMDSTEWYYAKSDLSDRFQLILWDLPGLGESAQPHDRNFALERLAQSLRAVLSTAKGKPLVLVGHSIGGMINLTFCRLFPDLLGREIAGIVQVDTTYTNPVKTTTNSELSQALQKPIAEPILYGMIGLSPLVRAMNWLSYQNGTLYLMNAKSSFAGAETRGQLDMVSRLQSGASPAVVARGTLAMFHWDATAVLPGVNVPALLLVGQQDTTTLPMASRQMQQMMPQARLAVVNPAAHYSLLEQNQRINIEIKQFAVAHLAPPAR